MAELNRSSISAAAGEQPLNISMGLRDIIVIGGSAGAIEAISEILSVLPKDLSAAIFIVVHVGPESPNYLVNIFGKCTPLPVQYAADRDPIELGRVYVAPNDRHLLVKRGEMRVVLGPKENSFRPAIDPLFRTAASTYHGRVIGVVVSGSLDDGTHGLMQIKRVGGVTIVQSPEEAIQKGMPASAIERVGVHFVKPAAEIGSLLGELVRGNGEVTTPLGEVETDVIEGKVSAFEVNGLPPPSPFICPECKGALWEVKEGEVVKYRCHVGHGFATDTLLSRQAIEIEQALWSAVRAFEERAELQRRTANRQDLSDATTRLRLTENARDLQRMAEVVRSLLTGPERMEGTTIGDLVVREYTGDS